ncbi:MAG: hydantoinase/oxoprolinase family protein [Archaeoglobaceae archaeon]
MVVGIDVGGTNTDAAIIGEDGIITVKMPSELGIASVLRELRRRTDLAAEKVVVSTSIPLNFVLSRFDEVKTLTILIPGPGLNYGSYGRVVRGYVNHRGDVVEEIDEEEVERILREESYDNLAVAAKFSVRNSQLEEKVKEIALKYVGEDRIALSHFAGGMSYPARINTTVVNAKIKATVHELTELVRSYAGDFYYYTGDGGITPYSVALENPSVLYNSSPAAVAMGAYFLTSEENAVVVDIGGTTTDIVFIENGSPRIVEGLELYGRKTLIRCVDAISVPFGGDSYVNGRLNPKKLDKPIAFGGKFFTLTDALNCLGHEIGNYRASREAGKNQDCESVVDAFVSQLGGILSSFEVEKIIGAGYLAPYLVPDIAERCGAKYVIPKHFECVNAIGVAVSRLSLRLYARFDTEKCVASYNGIVEECPFRRGSLPSEEEVVEVAKEKLREFAKNFGADESDFGEARIIYLSGFVVVRGGIRRGAVYDVVVQFEPGLRYDTGRFS